MATGSQQNRIEYRQSGIKFAQRGTPAEAKRIRSRKGRSAVRITTTIGDLLWSVSSKNRAQKIKTLFVLFRMTAPGHQEMVLGRGLTSSGNLLLEIDEILNVFGSNFGLIFHVLLQTAKCVN